MIFKTYNLSEEMSALACKFQFFVHHPVGPALIVGILVLNLLSHSTMGVTTVTL